MSGKYPELDKIQKRKESGESEIIGDFIEWYKRKYEICEYRESEEDEDGEIFPEGFYPLYIPTNKLLAEYFEIDLNKAEEERMQILEDIRKANGE